MVNPPPPHNASSSWLTETGKPKARRIRALVIAGLLGLVVVPTVAVLTPGVLDSWRPTGATPTMSAQPSPDASTPTPSPTPAPTVLEPINFTIAAVGDTLLHNPVHASARADGGYDFSPLLENISGLVNSAGLALCHMEIPLVRNGEKISGYPMFGGSAQIAQDYADQGWDGCSTASNHSVDKGWKGVVSTLDALEDAGLGFTGTGRTEEEAKEPVIYTVTVDGFDTSIAHISATRNLNGLPLPSDAPWSVNLIDVDDILAQAALARELGADLVVVSIHDGVEYTPTPTEDQREVASKLALSGQIDLFIGHHPHVPQPIEKLEGGPQGNGMWVAYSLGNFISNQDRNCCVSQTANGLMMFANVTSDRTEKPYISDVSWRALTVDRLGKHKVYDLSDLAAKGEGAGTLSAKEIQKRYKQVTEVVGTQAAEYQLDQPFTGSVVVEKRAGKLPTHLPQDSQDDASDTADG